MFSFKLLIIIYEIIFSLRKIVYSTVFVVVKILGRCLLFCLWPLFLQMHGYGNPAFIIPRPITGISPKWKCKMVVELAWKLTFFAQKYITSSNKSFSLEVYNTWIWSFNLAENKIENKNISSNSASKGIFSKIELIRRYVKQKTFSSIWNE